MNIIERLKSIFIKRNILTKDDIKDLVKLIYDDVLLSDEEIEKVVEEIYCFRNRRWVQN